MDQDLLGQHVSYQSVYQITRLQSICVSLKNSDIFTVQIISI